jgi:hypothetical protein
MASGGACGEAYFWATTETGDLAVTVSVDARDRSHEAPTTIDVAVPDAAVEVEILRGHDLARNFCTDVIDAASEPEDRQPAQAGRGQITLDPAPDDLGASCGDLGGELRLDGVIAEDGTTFAPITVTSDAIGCYSG